MLKNGAIRLLLYFLLQILVFIAAYELMVKLAFGMLEKADVAWGISLRMAVMVYCMVTFFVAVYANIVAKVKAVFMLAVGGFVVFSLLWLQGFSSYPYRTGVLLFSALLGFSSVALLKVLFQPRIKPL